MKWFLDFEASSLNLIHSYPIESSLLKAATVIVSHKTDHLPILGIPWIGCGLGGAKKDKVLEILHKIEDKIYTTIDSDRARNFQFHIYEFDG